jgi:hypothetical protein
MGNLSKESGLLMSPAVKPHHHRGRKFILKTHFSLPLSGSEGMNVRPSADDGLIAEAYGPVKPSLPFQTASIETP